VAVNPVSNIIYVTNGVSNNVTVITEQLSHFIPLITMIVPLPDRTSQIANPTFTFLSESYYTPIPTQPQQVYYQLDTLTGPWLSASHVIGGSPSMASNNSLGFEGSMLDEVSVVSEWRATLPTQSNGIHILYTFADDGQLSGSVNTSPNYSPIPGRISAYLFLVAVPTPTIIYLPLVLK